jgi:hypothetical protein
MDSLKNVSKEEEDPIMRLNPTLYKVVQNAKPDNQLDPFQSIMR